MFSQNSTYIRPTVVVTTVENGDSRVKNLNELLYHADGYYDMNRFNVRALQKKSHSSTTAKIPTFREYKGSGKELLDQELISTYSNLKADLSLVGKEVISDLFDYNGSEFGFTTLMNLAEYTASDVQKMTSSNSKDNTRIYFELGNELLDKLYIITIVVRRFETYDEMYKRLATPSKDQIHYGYNCEVDYYISQIDWNEETENYFYESCWSESNYSNSEKITKKSNYEKFQPKIKLVYSGRLNLASRNSNIYRNHPKYGISMDELFKNLGKNFYELLVYDVVKNSPEKVSFNFKLTASLSSTYPNIVKIGGIQGIKPNQRYFSYEEVLKSNGETKLKRKGVLRVKEVDINESSPYKSSFRQQGGRKLYPGMTVVEEISSSFNLTLGYNYLSTNNDFNRYNVSFNGGPFGGKKNIYFGVNLGYNYFKNQKYLASDTILSNVVTVPFGLEWARELYFTKRGNLFIYPSLCLNSTFVGLFAKTTVSEVDANGNGIWDSNELDDSRGMPIIFNSTASLGIGLHLGPNLSLLFRPQLNYNILTIETGPFKIVSQSELDQFWKFKYGISSNYFNTIALRIQF